MRKIGDFALVAIALILFVGLFLFKDYNRYQFSQDRGFTIYLIDTRTGDVWMSLNGERLPLTKLARNIN